MVHQLPLIVHFLAAPSIDTSGATTTILFILRFVAITAGCLLVLWMTKKLSKGENFFAALLFGISSVLGTASLPATSDAFITLFNTLFTINVPLTLIFYGGLSMFNPASQHHHEALGFAAAFGGFAIVLAEKGLLHV